MLNVAAYDAVNGICPSARSHHPNALPCTAPGDAARPRRRMGTCVAAAAVPAHAILVGLYPSRTAPYLDETRSRPDLLSLGSSGRVLSGKAWGEQAAHRCWRARASDGSSPEELSRRARVQVSSGRAGPRCNFRNLAPPSPSSTRMGTVSAGPPALTSLDYAAAFAEK